MSDGLPVVESHLASGVGWVLSRGRDARAGLVRLILTLAGRELAEVRQSLAVVGSVGGRHVADVLGTAALAEGSVAVVFADPGGPSAADLLRRRGSLSAGEVVTLVAPVAELVGSLSRRGMGLGEITAETLWLGSDGRPVVLPAGIGAQSGGGGADLAAWAGELLDRASPGAAEVAAVLDGAAAGRLDAEGLASALLRAVPAAAITMVAPSSGTPRRRAGRSLRARLTSIRLPALLLGRARPVVAVAVVALVAIALGGLWGRRDGGGTVLAAPPVPIVSATTPDVPSWSLVMSQLERARTQAYVTGDVARLDDVYADDSPTGARDRRMLSRLVARGQRVTGLRAFVEAVTVLTMSEGRVTLRVTDALTSYDVLSAAGVVVRHGSGRPARQWRIVLAKAAAGWRIWSVVP